MGARVFGWSALAGALSSALLVKTIGGGVPEWVFGAVMLAGLFSALTLAATGWRAARRETARARGLAWTRPEQLALEAMGEERRRLSADIEASIREALTRILYECERFRQRTPHDPVAALACVQREARSATSELRRQLGLLRSEEADTSPMPPAAPLDESGRLLTRRDRALGLGTAALAGGEIVAYVATGDMVTASTPVSVLLTALAAATVAGRRAAPVTAALTCSAFFVIGSLIGMPVGAGLWYVVTVGGLIWTLAARSPLAGLGGSALAVLVAVTLVARQLHSPVNLEVGVLVNGVALAGGLAVRVGTSRRHRAEQEALWRELELRGAVELAVRAERSSMARELHDVVSHAIGLIAVQAAAAQVSWPTDEASARRSLDLVQDTAAETLAELTRLVPGDSVATKSVADVEALVERIRASGTAVDLRIEGLPGPEVMRVAYRVVQESLTNAVRHAPGAKAAVRITHGPDHTTIEVRDDGPGLTGATSRGYGLVGLGERVTLAGGTFTAGSGPNGHGFCVHATLPDLRTSAVTP